ncbi:MAG: sigma-70 family RNA polymerase sigma factor [Planctomycetes bacterium]|nr:sigma-70 family RNA polymerase sigma factor [Planctomycetota bacterium]
MADVPATRASLVVRLRDRQDQSAWSEFVRLYTPLVYRYARRRGLQDADAADVTQDVLRSVSASVGAFDPRLGLFRSWLFTLAHRRLYDFLQNHQRQPSAAQETMQILDTLPARDDEASWNQEFERQLFSVAADLVRPTFSDNTWQAFQLAGVEGQSGQDVARSLGISVAAVYLAKSRVMVKLKAEVKRLQAE